MQYIVIQREEGIERCAHCQRYLYWGRWLTDDNKVLEEGERGDEAEPGRLSRSVPDACLLFARAPRSGVSARARSATHQSQPLGVGLPFAADHLEVALLYLFGDGAARADADLAVVDLAHRA